MDQQPATGVSHTPVFQIPDELLRPIASERATSSAAQADETWFRTKVEVFERPDVIINRINANPQSVAAFRSLTLKHAYRTIRRWQQQQPAVRRVQEEDPSCGTEFFPEEWIRALAHRRFDERGREHGRDKEDWYAAKAQLYEHFVPLMLRDVWSVELCQSLRAKSVDEAIQWLNEYFPASDRTSDERAVQLHPRKKERTMPPVIKTIHNPTSEDIERARTLASPIVKLTAAEFNKYRGCLIALLAEGNEKGKVIAHAPLNPKNPRAPREAIEKQVQASGYKTCRYVVHQVLHQPHTD